MRAGVPNRAETFRLLNDDIGGHANGLSLSLRQLHRKFSQRLHRPLGEKSIRHQAPIVLSALSKKHPLVPQYPRSHVAVTEG